MAVYLTHRSNSTQDDRPRKRARFGSPPKDIIDLWWDAMQSDALLGNALPVLRHAASDAPAAAAPPAAIVDPPRKAGQRARKKRRKSDDARMQKTLLYHMNNNVRTVRRVRETHARLTVLKETNAEDGAGIANAVVNLALSAEGLVRASTTHPSISVG